MIISARVRPNSKENRVERTAENELSVWIKAPAKEGRANEAVVELLGEYFGVARTRVEIVRGHKGKNKVIAIR